MVFDFFCKQTALANHHLTDEETWSYVVAVQWLACTRLSLRLEARTEAWIAPTNMRPRPIVIFTSKVEKIISVLHLDILKHWIIFVFSFFSHKCRLQLALDFFFEVKKLRIQWIFSEICYSALLVVF